MKTHTRLRPFVLLRLMMEDELVLPGMETRENNTRFPRGRSDSAPTPFRADAMETAIFKK